MFPGTIANAAKSLARPVVVIVLPRFHSAHGCPSVFTSLPFLHVNPSNEGAAVMNLCLKVSYIKSDDTPTPSNNRLEAGLSDPWVLSR